MVSNSWMNAARSSSFIVHARRKELPDRQDGIVNREDDAEDDDAADHLPEEHILGLIVLADVLVIFPTYGQYLSF